MMSTISHHIEEPPGLWLRPMPDTHRVNRGRAHTRVVMVPHAGAGVSTFTRWGACFPAGLEVLRVQLPGREDVRHAARATSVFAAATTLAGQLLALPEIPTVVYGHSMGAVIAFELTRCLFAAGRSPIHLCVSGRRAPHLPASRPPLHERDDEELLAGLAELSDTWHLLARTPEFLSDALDLVRYDLAMVEQYRYVAGPILEDGGVVPLPVPITACHGNRDPLVDADEAWSWSAHTASGFAGHTFAGDHFFPQQHRDRLTALFVSPPSTAEPAGS
ncbi:thioesterase [Gordonia sp. i37]|nr:thioesterase [Gordonia sp. i37]